MLTFSSTIPFFHSLSLPCGRILTMSPFSKSLRDFVLRSYYCFCLFFRSVISFFIWVAIFGLSNLFVVGKRVLVRRQYNRWTGELFIPSDEILHDSNARNGYSPDFSNFFIILFTVLTAFSAFPFDWGYPGELVTCTNS
jgi:hypothetical protein